MVYKILHSQDTLTD